MPAGLLTLLDCRCGGGGGGQLRCGGGAGGFRGPPFRIIGLTFSRIIEALGLAVAEDELKVEGGGGEGALPLDMPTRNWSRRAATLLLLLEEEGGWVMGGEGAWVVVPELCIRAVLTALKGVEEPLMLFRLLLE